MNAGGLRGQDGFTLIEMMVAMVVGLIVSTATVAIVITSVHLTSNYDDRVEATQQGRTAMVAITQRLNSSCVVATVAPILAASDANDVWFYSSFGLAHPDLPTILPNRVEMSVTGNSLVMYTSANTGSGNTPATWSFSAPAPFVLLANVAQVPSTPFFQYFGYGTAGALSTTAYPLATTLGANAASTAEVAINFQAVPSNGWTALSRPASFSDAVVLRFSAASNASGAVNLPCS